MFAPCMNSIKNLLLFQLMHNIIKNHRMLKQFKITTIAPTCFGSRRNHHQGAVLCLAKTTEYGCFCARRYRRSQCYGGISACCAGVRFTVKAETVSTVNNTVKRHSNVSCRCKVNTRYLTVWGARWRSG